MSKRPRQERSFSTVAGELSRNRFADTQPTEEVDEADEKPAARQSIEPKGPPDQQQLEATKKTFRKIRELKYVPNRLKRDQRELQRRRVREYEKYKQWGYLRHQYPKGELRSVQKEFNIWKSRIEALQDRKINKTDNAASADDAGKWLYELADISEMRSAWEAMSAEERQKKWPELMLTTLRNSPSKASMVLEATLDPLPPGYAIHDVLVFVGQNLNLDSIKNAHVRAAMADEVVGLLAHIIEVTPKRHVPFLQSTYGLFAKRLPAEQSRDWYEVLRQQGFNLHKNTLLHFASKLAGKSALKNSAYEILKLMVQRGETLQDASSASAVTTLLHCKAESDGWTQNSESFAAKDALQLFMEHGYTPNIITLTAVLDSLCQHGQTEEAVRLALLFADAGLELDEKTWTTLFAGAKSSLNVDNISKALMVAKVTTTSYENVLSNALHALFYFADTETRTKRIKVPWSIPVFRPMLKIYSKKFELRSLQWWLPESLPLLLGDEGLDSAVDDKFRDPRDRQWDFTHTIQPVVDQLFSTGVDGREAKLQPNATADGVMLRAYIRSLSHPQDILSFYKFFKSRLEEDSIYSSVMLESQGAMIHDAFILAMTEHKELWREALHVFGDMLKDTFLTKAATKRRNDLKEAVKSADEVIDPAAASTEAAPRAPVHPPPTVFTMTILLRGLLYQGETALADQMMQVMREFNIEPNLVTWNTLIKHHALAQNTGVTVHLLQDLEATGLKPDVHTYNAFNKLRDQNKALGMMQSIIDQNRRSIVGG